MIDQEKQQQLTISTLRQELTRLQHDHGDLPVVLNDADTGWFFLLKAKHLVVESDDNAAHGKKLIITVDYGDEMEDR